MHPLTHCNKHSLYHLKIYSNKSVPFLYKPINCSGVFEFERVVNSLTTTTWIEKFLYQVNQNPPVPFRFKDTNFTEKIPQYLRPENYFFVSLS